MSEFMWSRIDLTKSRSKDLIIEEIEAVLDHSGYEIVESDVEKPWGGYFKIDREQTDRFIEEFFKTVVLPDWAQGLPLDPKILFVEANKRLSWQYHDRRGEVWTVVGGPVGVYISDTNDMPENPKVYEAGSVVQIHPKARHRLAGIDNWGIVAEIWVHTDKMNPSNEQEIHRLQDDFGREDSE